MDRPFKDPGIPDGETTRYRLQIGDREAGTATISIKAADSAGDEPSTYVQRIELHFDQTTRAEAEFVFHRDNGNIHIANYRGETYDGDTLVAAGQANFRDVRALQLGGQIEPLPVGLTPFLAGSLAFRGLDFERGTRRGAALWLMNAFHWEVSIKVDGDARIRIPAGSFTATKVTVRPSFAQMSKQIDRLVGFFLPAFVLHFDKAAPHRMLSFEFPTGPFPGQPKGNFEATEL